MQAGIAFDLIPPSDRLKLLDMIGAVVYIRVSTKEQTENLSLPTQLRACEDYCRRESYEVLERFRVWQERRATVKKEIDQRSQREINPAETRSPGQRVHFRASHRSRDL